MAFLLTHFMKDKFVIYLPNKDLLSYLVKTSTGSMMEL